MATGGLRAASATPSAPLAATADSIIFVYIGGGQAAAETWDPKRYTPYKQGMKASEVHSTFPSIATSVDGIRFSQGLEQCAALMHKGTVIPTLKPGFLGASFHVRHMFYLHTAYKPPQSVAVPAIGSVVARTLGALHSDVPAFVDIGQRLDIPGSTAEVKASHAPGFLGSTYGPFSVPDPGAAVASVRPPSGMSQARFHDRFRRYQKLMRERALQQDNPQKRDEFLESIDAAHRLMDSPAAAALDLDREPRSSYQKYNTGKFGLGCLLARRLVEAGTRFVEVSFEFLPFELWDTHENGHERAAKLKQELDAPLAQLIRDLDERGRLNRTLIVLASEFNRSMLVEGDGDKVSSFNAALDKKFPGLATPVQSIVSAPKHYGLHRHLNSTSTALMFGGGIKQGFRYGRTSDEPPFNDVEKPLEMPDFHATVYRALGIPADLSYEVETRPVFVTPDGKGKPCLELFG